MLVQERMSHIEELRLIHADINIVCSGEKKIFCFISFIRRWKQQ
jgi:hypothetical protein